MLNCAKCGNALQPGAKSCTFCGAVIPDSTEPGVPAPTGAALKCPRCGAAVPSGAAFCLNCGIPFLKESQKHAPTGVSIRCSRCGTLMDAGDKVCEVCNQTALSPQEFDFLARKAPLARQIKEKHGSRILLLITILLLLLVFLLAGIINGRYLLRETFLMLLAGTVVFSVVIWGIARAAAFRKAGLTYAEYQTLLAQWKKLPKEFFLPLFVTAPAPAPPRAVPVLQTVPPVEKQATPEPAKKKMGAFGYVIISFAILFFAYFAGVNVLFPDSGGGSIDGRWVNGVDS